MRAEIDALKSENAKQAAELATEVDKDLCVVCIEKARSWMSAPCGHLSMCETCMFQIKNQRKQCPECRAEIEQTFRVYST